MNENMKILIEGLERLNIKKDGEKAEKLLEYMNLVLETNRHFNLTAITEEKEFIEKNILDSLTGLDSFEDGKRIMDLGSGAGLPGIVLGIYLENSDIVLVDSLKKRVDFLERTAKALGLANVTAVHERAEELSRDPSFRESFDFVTARAVARMNTLLEYTIPFLKVGGKLVLYKASRADEEVREAENALNVLGAKVIRTNRLSLPFSDDERNLITVEKTDKTPDRYPRRPARIKKRPL